MLTSRFDRYPNPFNSILQVSYTSIKNEAVSLDLYNLRGERAKQLFHGKLHADQTYNWQFDVKDIDKQVYLLIIKGRNTYTTRKIVKH